MNYKQLKLSVLRQEIVMFDKKIINFEKTKNC